MHLMFEWGGGTLWGKDTATFERFGVGHIEDRLDLTTETRAHLEELSRWHDGALDWADPAGPSPWSAAEFAEFEVAARAILDAVQQELGRDFEVVYRPLGRPAG